MLLDYEVFISKRWDRKKVKIARSKAISDDSGTIQKDKRFAEDKIRNMYIQINKVIEE